MATRKRANRAGVGISQELIAILALGVVVVGSFWRLDDDIDLLRERIVRLEAANEARITGRVTAGEDRVLPGVMVVASRPPRLIPGTGGTFADNKGAYTDATGCYMIDGLRPGVYELTFTTAPGHRTTRKQEVSAGSTVIVDAEL